MTAQQTPVDPYDLPNPWWKRHPDHAAALAVLFLGTLLTVLAFPPFQVPEFAYAMAAPAIFWAYRKPPFKLFAATVLSSQVIAWTIILGWIHHVSWAAFALLGPIVGLWVGSWFLALHWAMPRFIGKNVLSRLVGMLGLAALWVLVEWTRTWLLGGFPWLPLSSSQWQRVSILQISAFTGAYGVSFVLIAVNIGFAAYAHRLLCEGARGLRRRSQEFFACLFLLLCCVSVHVQEAFNRGRFLIPYGRITLIQPNVPQSLKWDQEQVDKVIAQLEESTRLAAKTLPDLMVWPEASTPMALLADPSARVWLEDLVKESKAPLLLGAIGVRNHGTEMERWFNGAFIVDPDTGLVPTWYAKRHLVPFGEYVPLRGALGWLQKVVPVGPDDFTAGDDPAPLLIRLKKHIVGAGPLICYEDIFPSLARESAQAGSEILFVLNNMAWYGESPASIQHMTHSVLRAVETRRPVLRCGNNGWSGWIDEFGNVRKVIATKERGTFIRANATVTLERDSRWINRQSFYTQYGDWFVGVCAALAALAWALLRLPSPKQEPEENA